MAGIWQYRNKWKCQVRKEGFPSQSKTFDTKAEAVAWGIEVEARMNRGECQDFCVSEVISEFNALSQVRREALGE